jgi:hypothetical protein
MANQDQFQFTIGAGKTERHYWMELWRYRELWARPYLTHKSNVLRSQYRLQLKPVMCVLRLGIHIDLNHAAQ